MQQFLIALAVVVVLGGAYYLWQGDSFEAPAGDSSEVIDDGVIDNGVMEDNDRSGAGEGTMGEIAATITYTEDGYSPASVTVSPGQTVRWVNSSARDTWPASAVHPTHSIYPEQTASDCLGSAFDACRGLTRGESWDFTFNQAGEWRYHDHLRSSQTGVVIVQ